MGTKVYAVADVHLGNHKRFGGPVVAGINNRCRMVLKAYEDALSFAAGQEPCQSAFVVLGDLFDTDRPSPQLLAEVQKIHEKCKLRAIPGAYPRLFLLLGNHDQTSNHADDHALGPLAFQSSIDVVARPRVVLVGNIELNLIPYGPGSAKTWIQDSVRFLDKNRSVRNPGVLCIHAGVRDEFTPKYMQSAPDSIDKVSLAKIAASANCSTVLAGNWHQHDRWIVPVPGFGDVTICQVGALCPTGFDNKGIEPYGGVQILNFEDGATPTIRRKDIGGPRFLVFKGQLASIVSDVKDSAFIDRYQHFLRFEVVPEELGAASEYIAGLISDGTIAGGEVVVNNEDVREKASVAAKATRSLAALDEAVDSYVSTMHVEECVSKEEVTTRVRRYLGL